MNAGNPDYAPCQVKGFQEYVLVVQDQTEVTVFRRAGRWQPEIIQSLDALLRLDSVNFSLPLNQVYEGIKL